MFRGETSVSQTGYQTSAALPITEERLSTGISQLGDAFCKGSSPLGNFPFPTTSFVVQFPVLILE